MLKRDLRASLQLDILSCALNETLEVNTHSSFCSASYYTDLYIQLKARYMRKGTLYAGIKLCKIVAVSTLLLPVQSHSGFRFAT
ncbi:MAG: hypothetical protein FJ266_04935 [Planctomycetes bacterium]|nr:hypothetical protein [Planctomycetota bacterium]